MMFKKKRKEPDILDLADMTSRMRGLIMDSQIQNANELSQSLGCPTISAELEEHELSESDSRVERIEHLLPLLMAHSTLITQATTHEYKATHKSITYDQGFVSLANPCPLVEIRTPPKQQR